MANSNEYMREYMKKRYFRRRNETIERFGGKCELCGSAESLEFHHRDPSTKTFPVAKAFAGWSDVRLQAELEKCQLLCGECHKQFTKPFLHKFQLERQAKIREARLRSSVG